MWLANLSAIEPVTSAPEGNSASCCIGLLRRNCCVSFWLLCGWGGASGTTQAVASAAECNACLWIPWHGGVYLGPLPPKCN